MKRALYWKVAEGENVRCELCPNRCLIQDGNSGSCGVRRNKDGVLYAESYGLISASHLDPIEKKPLYHFRPGSEIFSIGGWGCNLHCSFCQNWSISQEFIRGRKQLRPEDIVAAAERSGTSAIAYTYNEPLIAMEFVLDCAALAKTKNLNNVAVTNGYIEGKAAEDAVSALDAFNVDIKSMDDEFYRRNCGGKLKPVLEFCKAIRAAGKHLEITNLIIPGENDSDGLLEALASWVHQNLGADVPLHFSAYRPEFKMMNPATGTDVLERACKIASAKLQYVYLGNLVSEQGQNTSCSGCGVDLINRKGYFTAVKALRDGSCPNCGAKLKGFVW